MATVTSLGSLLNTTAGNKTVTATPAAGDLIVVVEASSGLVPPGATTGISDDNPDGLGTYTQAVGPAVGFSTNGNVSIWIRNALIGTATSTIFTQTETGSSGGGLNVFAVAGMSLTGLAAVYSSGVTNSGGQNSLPTVAMSLTPDTTFPVIAAVANVSTPAGVAPQSSPIVYTEDVDTFYVSPTLGLETMFINSGETDNVIRWGSNSVSQFGAVAVQLDATGSDVVGGLHLTLVGHARRVRGG